MFDRLRSAIAALTTVASQRTLTEGEVDKILWNFEVALLESDVAQEVVEYLVAEIKNEVMGSKIHRSEDPSAMIRKRLLDSIRAILTRAPQIDIPEMVKSRRLKGEPFTILFLGINGTGKTTSIAKFAYMLKQKDFSVVLACADTHRAGAIEQLSEHAECLSLKVISQRYGADPAAVGRDAVLYAKSHRVDVVLIDTAGRMQLNRNLMEEMAKIARVVDPDLRVFVGDALAGNDAVSQAKEFMSFTNFDAAILAKADADVKGGAALSISYVTGRPIIYLGLGQRYEDLAPFNPDTFANSLFPNV